MLFVVAMDEKIASLVLTLGDTEDERLLLFVAVCTILLEVSQGELMGTHQVELCQPVKVRI